MDLEVKEKKDWVAEHTLTKQDLRKLILEKIERAKLLHRVEENRNRTDREFA